jgi:hypothetical protein
MTKSKAAYLFSSERLGQQTLFMWTFTFKEALGNPIGCAPRMSYWEALKR